MNSPLTDQLARARAWCNGHDPVPELLTMYGAESLAELTLEQIKAFNDAKLEAAKAEIERFASPAARRLRPARVKDGILLRR